MEPFIKHTGLVAPHRSRQCRHRSDGAQAISQSCCTRDGFGRILFYDWRYLPGEKPNPDFVLNFPRYKGASACLLARDNFGCGSSREHAPWAILDYGFRVILAPSYADIFYNNCFKNGILPAALTERQIDELFKRAEKEEGYTLTVDLRANRHRQPGPRYSFDIDPFRKDCLLKGLDDIGTTFKNEPDITAYEKSHTGTATMFEPVDVKNYSEAH